MSDNRFEDWRKRSLPASDTSDEAGASVDAKTIRMQVLRAIHQCGGLTCDEAEARLGLSHQTCSARFSEMWHDYKFIEQSGIKRKTRSDRNAHVYTITERGQQHLQSEERTPA